MQKTKKKKYQPNELENTDTISQLNKYKVKVMPHKTLKNEVKLKKYYASMKIRNKTRKLLKNVC